MGGQRLLQHSQGQCWLLSGLKRLQLRGEPDPAPVPRAMGRCRPCPAVQSRPRRRGVKPSAGGDALVLEVPGQPACSAPAGSHVTRSILRLP